jgi:hypothetical protein
LRRRFANPAGARGNRAATLSPPGNRTRFFLFRLPKCSRAAETQRVLEIGAASFPLLMLPGRGGSDAVARALITRDAVTIGLAVVVYAAFVATLGRGLSA